MFDKRVVEAHKGPSLLTKFDDPIIPAHKVLSLLTKFDSAIIPAHKVPSLLSKSPPCSQSTISTLKVPSLLTVSFLLTKYYPCSQSPIPAHKVRWPHHPCSQSPILYYVYIHNLVLTWYVISETSQNIGVMLHVFPMHEYLLGLYVVNAHHCQWISMALSCRINLRTEICLPRNTHSPFLSSTQKNKLKDSARVWNGHIEFIL